MLGLVFPIRGVLPAGSWPTRRTRLTETETQTHPPSPLLLADWRQQSLCFTTEEGAFC